MVDLSINNEDIGYSNNNNDYIYLLLIHIVFHKHNKNMDQYLNITLIKELHFLVFELNNILLIVNIIQHHIQELFLLFSEEIKYIEIILLLLQKACLNYQFQYF